MRLFLRIVLIVGGIVLGGRAGLRLMLPPDPPPGEIACGMPAIGAVVFGLPAGIVVGGTLGLLIGRAMEAMLLAHRSRKTFIPFDDEIA